MADIYDKAASAGIVKELQTMKQLSLKEPAQNGCDVKRAPQRISVFLPCLGARFRRLCAQLSIVVLAMTASSWAAEPSSKAKEAVLSAESAWKEAVLKRDGNALNKLLSDELSYTHSSAKTQTKEEFIQDVTSGTTS